VNGQAGFPLLRLRVLSQRKPLQERKKRSKKPFNTTRILGKYQNQQSVRSSLAKHCIVKYVIAKGRKIRYSFSRCQLDRTLSTTRESDKGKCVRRFGARVDAFRRKERLRAKDL
jgi:hypothetical protein